jgi:hypothetical protein
VTTRSPRRCWRSSDARHGPANPSIWQQALAFFGGSLTLDEVADLYGAFAYYLDAIGAILAVARAQILVEAVPARDHRSLLP